MKYKVGDKVKLRESSQFYYQAPNEIGEIIELTGDQDGDPEYTIFCFIIKFPSITNGYRPIDVKLVEPASLVGRYIKALVDRPNGGDVKKGEIGRIIRHQIVDFPSQKDYCISLPLITSKYELLPIDYYELLPIDDDVSKPSYIAQPFPSDGEYIKLIVKHDILRGNREHMHVTGSIPDVIPKGTVTWCNKGYKSNILDNDIICIEGNKYCANIYASCFEIHPDSKHLFEKSTKSIDKLDDDTEVPPIVVHCTTEKEFKHVVKHHNLSKYMSFTTYLGETGVCINGMCNYDGWTSIHNWKSIKNLKILTYSEWVSKYNPVLDNPILEPIKPCPKFKVGDSVVVIAESHGWGDDVEYGDIGVVKSLESDGDYYVDFPNHKSWQGKESCFQLAETVGETSTTGENITFSLTNTELVTKITNPIKDVESVNVSITKKSKIRVLSI
jgi:hypothetical protein